MFQAADALAAAPAIAHEIQAIPLHAVAVRLMTVEQA